MIRDYTDHAANERTYLAWARTGFAVMALGFVIEKFDLFVVTLGATLQGAAAEPLRRHLERLAGPLERQGGGVLVLGGIALIAVATARFVHTRGLISDERTHSGNAGRAELAILAGLLLLAAGFGAYLALG